MKKMLFTIAALLVAANVNAAPATGAKVEFARSSGFRVNEGAQKLMEASAANPKLGGKVNAGAALIAKLNDRTEKAIKEKDDAALLRGEKVAENIGNIINTFSGLANKGGDNELVAGVLISTFLDSYANNDRMEDIQLNAARALQLALPEKYGNKSIQEIVQALQESGCFTKKPAKKA